MNRSLTVGLQFRDILKFPGGAIDNPHRPLLKHPLVRGRYVDDPAIAVSSVVQDLRIQAEYRLFRPFQDLREQTAAVDQNTADALEWVVPSRCLQDVLHLFVRYHLRGVAKVKKSNHFIASVLNPTATIRTFSAAHIDTMPSVIACFGLLVSTSRTRQYERLADDTSTYYGAVRVGYVGVGNVANPGFPNR